MKDPYTGSVGENLYVGDDLYIIRTREDFAKMVEEKLGYEAAKLMLELYPDPFAQAPCDDPNTPSCTGECVHTYRMQEHYERGISDAVEALELLKKAKRKNDDTIQRIIKHLKGL